MICLIFNIMQYFDINLRFLIREKDNPYDLNRMGYSMLNSNQFIEISIEIWLMIGLFGSSFSSSEVP